MEKVEFENLIELTYAKKEAFNSIRTNLSFCGSDIKTILITSCSPDEGKTSTAMGLARTLANDNKRVVLIDCDLRKSSMIGQYHAVNQKKEIKGLSHYLSGQAMMQDVLYETNQENLSIIFAGRSTPNPTQLLGTDLFHSLLDWAREHFDMVIIDTPPLGTVIDAAIIAPRCDGAILLVESNKNSYKFLQTVKKQLEVTGVKILGVILNKMQTDKNGYYNRYYKHYYKKYYGNYNDTSSKQ
ncbi:MAG: CpsD/CapB family tyrosine-protein kinase [bacterium]|nr:CpsD/CapB family tyrosine-protein kinase [bacterium]